MKTKSLIILFVFGLLFECAYSITTRKDKFELPIIYYNNTNIKHKYRTVNPQTLKIGNTKFFLFRLKDLYKASDGIYQDYFFFQLNSTFMKTNVSYAIVNEKLSHITVNSPLTTYRYFNPNITYKQYIGKKMSNHMVVYANRTEKSSRDTLIIRVGEQKGETLELLPLPSLPSVLKIQFNNMINSQKYKYDNGRKDIKDEFRKINGNWRKVESDWNNLRNKRPLPSTSYDYNRRYKSRRHERIFMGFVWFGIVLAIISYFIIIAYILVNRRKKTFTGVLKNPVVPLNNQSV